MRPPWRRPDPAEVLDDVAGAVDRLVALVLAGAGPDVAWRYLSPIRPRRPSSRRAGQGGCGCRTGRPPAPVRDRGLNRRRALDAGRAARRPRRDRRSAAGRGADPGCRRAALRRRAAPRGRHLGRRSRGERTTDAPAAARVRLLGWAFGLDVPGAVATPLGGAAMILAVVLLLAARRWSARLIRQAAAVPWERGVGLELVALSLRAGRPTAAVLADAEAAAAAAGLPVTGDVAAVGRLLSFAERSGAPLARCWTPKRTGCAARRSPKPGAGRRHWPPGCSSRSARSCCRRSCWPAPSPSGWPSSPPQPSSGDPIGLRVHAARCVVERRATICCPCELPI